MLFNVLNYRPEYNKKKDYNPYSNSQKSLVSKEKKIGQIQESIKDLHQISMLPVVKFQGK